jgi:hypothetical protein
MLHGLGGWVPDITWVPGSSWVALPVRPRFRMRLGARGREDYFGRLIMGRSRVGYDRGEFSVRNEVWLRRNVGFDPDIDELWEDVNAYRLSQVP